MSDDDEKGFEPGARPLCVFCSAPWSDDMIKVEIDTACYDSGCSVSASVEIKCENCKRLIYSKECY